MGAVENKPGQALGKNLKTAARVDARLDPPWHHPRYYGLRAVRRGLEGVLQKHLRQTGSGVAHGGLSVVDFGCGSTPYQPLLIELAGRYIRADIPANVNKDVAIDPATGKVDLPEGEVDVVLSTQVLEHVHSPADYLAEAKRLLKPGGKLILSTHGFWKYHPDPTDFWRWTASGLNKLLVQSGFDVIEHVGVLGFASASACLFQDAVAQKLPKALRPPVAVVMQRVAMALDCAYTPQQRQENAAVYIFVATPVAEGGRQAVAA